MRRYWCGLRGIGRIAPVLMVLSMLPLAAGAAVAQETPPPSVEISASHSVTGSVDQGDGTYAVSYQVTLTNNSSVDLDAISLTPVSDKLQSFRSRSSSLDAGLLMAGSTVTVSWTATQLFPGDERFPISFYGSATDGLGTAIPVAVVSRRGTGQ